MKRIIATILCCIIALTILPLASFAATSEREVVDEGYCSAISDEESYKNVKWTLYDDGELVVTGKGDTENLYNIVFNTEATTLRICEGINTIKFEVWNNTESSFFRYTKLNKIVIPKSADHLSKLKIPESTYPNRKFIICYGGTEQEWKALAKEENFSKSVCDFYFEGQEPAPYCKIDCENGVVEAPALENKEIKVNYYCGNSDACYFRYTWQESKVKLTCMSDIYCKQSVATIMPKKKGESTLKVELIDGDTEKVLASDTVTIKATKSNQDSVGAYIGFIRSLSLPEFLTVLLSLPALPFYWIHGMVSK